jgi:hypothetical protein
VRQNAGKCGRFDFLFSMFDVLLILGWDD